MPRSFDNIEKTPLPAPQDTVRRRSNAKSYLALSEVRLGRKALSAISRPLCPSLTSPGLEISKQEYVMKSYQSQPLITDENLINFNRSEEEMQIFWLYCGFSVQRSRQQAQNALAKLLDMGEGKLPLDRIRFLLENKKLRSALETTRIGSYKRLERFLTDSANATPDFRNGTVDDFSRIHGIGSAKARFFLLNTRQNAHVAVLDRHILAELRSLGYDVPDHTPNKEAEYRRCEAYFLKEADKAGVAPAQFNLSNWRKRAQRNGAKYS